MNQPLPLPIFVLIVVAIISWPLIRKYAPKFFSRSKVKIDKPVSSLSLLKWALRDPTTRRRLFFSAALILVLGLAHGIPLPGIQSSSSSHIGLPAMNQLFPELHLSLFLFGITPFLLACSTLQVGSAFIPVLKQWTFNSSDSRRNLIRATWVVAFVLIVIQAYSVGVSLENNEISSSSGLGFLIFVVLTLTASMGFLLFMAHLIQRFGMGNGIALVAVSLVFPQLISALRHLFNDPTMVSMSVIVLPLSVGLFFTAYHLARKARFMDLILNGKKQITVRLPFRPTVVGDVPHYIASSILLFPLTLATLLSSEIIHNIAAAIMNGWLHFVLFTLLVGAAAYIYTLLVFKPRYLCTFMERFGYESGETGKRPSAQSLNRQMSRTLLMTILFIVIATYLQMFAVVSLDISFSITKILLGWPVIVLGGVAADIILQISFRHDKSVSGIENWETCHVVGDEWEATLKASYLTSQGIPALIEPLRFSWGIPTRTIVDEYRVHVPKESCKEAGNLLDEKVPHTFSLTTNQKSR